MTYDPAIHHRRSIRKKDFDYAQPGAYFVTICTQFRQFVLDDPVVAGIIKDVWLTLPLWFPTIGLDELTIMPNHTHSIIWLVVDPEGGDGLNSPPALTLPPPFDPQIQIYGRPDGGRPQGCAPTGDWTIPAVQTTNDRPRLGEVVGTWKSLVTTVYVDWIKEHDSTRRAKFWQRNYYDRIIRNDRMLWAVRQYIRDNPQNWAADPDNPANYLNLPLPATIEDYLTDIRRHTPYP